MAEETENKLKVRSRKKVTVWWVYLLIGFVASVIVTSMGYIYYLGNQITLIETPLMDAAMELKNKTTTGHLWFEEILSGDSTLSIDDVLEHLDLADWYAHAMLEGGQRANCKYFPLSDLHMRQDITEVRSNLAKFREITLQRWQVGKTAGIGTEIEQQQDKVFSDLEHQVDLLEIHLQQIIGKEITYFKIVQIVLIVICLTITVVVGIMFSHSLKNKIKHKLELQSANQQLDASNQQLLAGEQQLKAINQQLMASEQHTKAINHQLDASNQQLLAVQEEHRKLIHDMGERIKELNCLYGLTRLNKQYDITLEEIFHDLVELIPPGWHYPEITCARVVFNGSEFKTANFKQTKWRQSSDIIVSGRQVGVIEVCYLKECPVLDEGPFLKEERNLIDGLSRLLSEIIERKQVEAKQAELLEKVDNINKELKEFASIVSHDLKAPLRGIKTLATWILTDCEDKLGEEAGEQINLLLERVERMYMLIEGTLQYSRAGRTEGKRVQLNLNDFVPEIVNMVVPPDNITVTIENELPVIEGEEVHFMQIFQNLLSNAIKYMDKPEGRIKIGCVEQDGYWKFSISDNGPGIEEAHFEKIFKIFQTLPTSRDFVGTGVGLTVVKKIIELYEGTIYIESKVGEGSTFFFTLPKQETAASNEKLESTSTCLI